MTHVATLIGPPPALDAALVNARAVLPGAGAARALGPGAADIFFTPAPDGRQRDLGEKLRAALAPTMDVVVQPLARRRKKLFLADMDSTMIGQECLDELADHLGLKARVAAITDRAMRGEIDFAPALRERVALLRGLPVAAIEQVLRERIKPTPGARTLISTLRRQGVRTCLVSGGFTLFAEPIAAMLGFDEVRANTLTLAGDTLAGTVAEPIFGRDGKRDALIELRQMLGLAREETMAVGDGANDLAMIAEAGLGLAFHAKPKLAQAAAARIDHADLTALLYVQGYRREEFVKG
jgi:phosphoserine phosphatase